MNGNDRNLIRALRGPVTLITLGVLFALNNFTPFGFDKTWPVLLIVFGMLSMLRRGCDPPRPRGPGGPGFTPYEYPPPPGGYRQTPYTTPPPPPGAGNPPGDAI
ncbi:MAG TPA: DUF5668 domain-containing protein [Bryobacteraceae bacterium]|nr:DUF5668 domain-containing protein [Bryobacteraceae bacterium]